MNRRIYIQQSAILQRRYEAKYFHPVRRLIKAEVDNVIRAIRYYGEINDGMQEAMKIVTIKGLPSVIEDLYQVVGGRFARRTWISLQEAKRQSKKSKSVPYHEKTMQVKAFGFAADWVQFIKDFLFRFLLEKITFEVAETTRNIILTTLNKAVTEGWGLEKTIKELEDLPLSKTQAARIVRTEVTRAANTGVMAAGNSFEFEQTKEWISAHDKRTRGVNPKDHASHVGLDGITIDFDDVFTDPRNGDKLRFPGDPNASATSTINCRCNIAVVPKVDERGRLIPKKQNVAA